MQTRIWRTGRALATPMLKRGRRRRRLRHLAQRGIALHRQADRAARDLRRPGRHRHRERAPVQGAGGAQQRPRRVARAADGDGRDPPRHQQLADGRPARVRGDRRSNSLRLCDGYVQHRLPVRRRRWSIWSPLRNLRPGGRSRPSARHFPMPPSRAGASARAILTRRRRPHPGCAARTREYRAPGRSRRPSAIGASSACRCCATASPIGTITVGRGEPEPFSGQADRAAQDLRRPGGDRHRERAALHGDARTRRSSSRSPTGTSRSSSPTCPTSCARRSTPSSASPRC